MIPQPDLFMEADMKGHSAADVSIVLIKVLGSRRVTGGGRKIGYKSEMPNSFWVRKQIMVVMS